MLIEDVSLQPESTLKGSSKRKNVLTLIEVRDRIHLKPPQACPRLRGPSADPPPKHISHSQEVRMEKNLVLRRAGGCFLVLSAVFYLTAIFWRVIYKRFCKEYCNAFCGGDAFSLRSGSYARGASKESRTD